MHLLSNKTSTQSSCRQNTSQLQDAYHGSFQRAALTARGQQLVAAIIKSDETDNTCSTVPFWCLPLHSSPHTQYIYTVFKAVSPDTQHITSEFSAGYLVASFLTLVRRRERSRERESLALFCASNWFSVLCSVVWSHNLLCLYFKCCYLIVLFATCSFSSNINL